MRGLGGKMGGFRMGKGWEGRIGWGMDGREVRRRGHGGKGI